MVITKTLDYAVRTLLYLAIQPGKTAYMKDIAEAQHVPMPYLAKVTRFLVKAGIVSSAFGPHGGYTLKKDPKNITMKQVYEAVEGELKLLDCFEDPTICALTHTCYQSGFWNELQNSIINILEKTTLEDIMKRNYHRRDVITSIPIIVNQYDPWIG